MQTSEQPAGYTAPQIILHWVIAALVIFQLVFGEDVGPAYRAIRRGGEATPDDMFNANIHIYVGITVLILACLRFGLRLSFGAPPAPAAESQPQRLAAAGIHALLYLAIFIMPLTGLAAWYLGIGALGEAHEIGKPVLIIAVALHVAGALWQHFVAKSDVLTRMLRPAGQRRSR